jgi:NADH-quinone oxidoreductase E subunit
MSVKTQDDLAVLLERYPTSSGQAALMALLQDIQDRFGYLSEENLEQVGEHLHIPLSHVYGVVSFYSQFSLVPRGKNIIKLCMGTACHIRGAQSVLDEIQSTLGIGNKETTADMQFTLEAVRCLGTCFLAPVMMINDKYYGMLSPAKVNKILKQYQRES